MEFIPIIHRVNNTNKLSTIPTEYGVEIDIRIENNNLYLSHDPIKNINNKHNANAATGPVAICNMASLVIRSPLYNGVGHAHRQPCYALVC